MTPIADMLEQMFADGIPRAAIVAAVRAFETSTRRQVDASGGRQVDVAAEKRRAWERQYRKNKRKQRNTQTGKQTMSGETSTRASGGQAGGCEENRCCLSSSLDSQSLQKEEPTTVVVEGQARGTRLGQNWKPSDADRQFAREYGMSDARIDEFAAEFRDYWIGIPGQRGRKSDWPATWRNRVREKGKGNGHAANRPARRTIQDAARDLHERVLAEELGDLARPPPLRLVP